MHLVCLGVMKKLLLLWRGEKRSASNKRPRKTKRTDKQAKDRVFRLSAIAQETINNRIIALSKCFPVEFQRKRRSLEEIEDWKAVEFRTFLLYSGPIVLKGVLSDEQYDHFLYFHIAIRILCSSSSTEEQMNYADQCLYHRRPSTFHINLEWFTEVTNWFIMYIPSLTWPMTAVF